MKSRFGGRWRAVRYYLIRLLVLLLLAGLWYWCIQLPIPEEIPSRSLKI